MLKTDYLGCWAPEIPLKFWQCEALHLWRLGSATYSMSKWVIYRDWNRDHESQVLSPLYLTPGFLAATNRYIMVRQQVIWGLLKLFFINIARKITILSIWTRIWIECLFPLCVSCDFLVLCDLAHNAIKPFLWLNFCKNYRVAIFIRVYLQVSYL